MALAGSREMLARRPVVDILGRAGADAGVRAAYLADHPGVDTAGLVGQYITDAVFRAGVVRVAAARGAARTWVYRFSWRSPVTGEAMHCIDVPFFFDCLDADRVPAIAGSNAP
jgi:para-nitrobenzyl esterase